MGWEVRGNRRYYTRSVRVDGKVTRQYVGGGPAGELAAAPDALRRARRRARARARRAELAAGREAADLTRQLERATDLLLRAALVAAGYHQHDRGAWRRKRDGPTDLSPRPRPRSPRAPGADPRPRQGR